MARKKAQKPEELVTKLQSVTANPSSLVGADCARWKGNDGRSGRNWRQSVMPVRHLLPAHAERQQAFAVEVSADEL